MYWWGRLIGALFGFLLAGPIGAIIGVIVGYFFDQGLKQSQRLGGIGNFGEAQAHSRELFFYATFSVMGHIAKADGRVSKDEIRVAEQVMHHLGLNASMRAQAIAAFRAGKQPDFNLRKALADLVRACHHRRYLLRIFLDFQYQAAMAEGFIGPRKRHILQLIAAELGFSVFEFDQFEQGYEGIGGARPGQARVDRAHQLANAYNILGIDQNATDAQVKRAYRKLMSQHHPDKLIAKGLPESMLKVATEKTQQIKAAYDTIRQTRGI